jgi:hypothetical protein
MIANGKLRVLDLAAEQGQGASKLLAANASGQLVFADYPTIALADPPTSAYNALPSGSVFKVEFELGSTIYYQLFQKP